MNRSIDPQHDQTRDLLRVVGPAVVAVGLIFMVIGIGNFFLAFGSFEPPRYFWCAFVGIPLLAIGTGICRYAFLGAVGRYIAQETTPVGIDVMNSVAEGTQGAVRNLAAAVGEGLRGSAPDTKAQHLHCPACHTENETSAQFCKSCGVPLARRIVCSACGKANDPDARFCDSCGKAIAS